MFFFKQQTEIFLFILVILVKNSRVDKSIYLSILENTEQLLC